MLGKLQKRALNNNCSSGQIGAVEEGTVWSEEAAGQNILNKKGVQCGPQEW